jgi:tetratricopeptide (TPR) repeat protein
VDCGHKNWVNVAAKKSACQTDEMLIDGFHEIRGTTTFRLTQTTYQGKLEEAIAALKTAIRINPKQSAAHVNLGNIYLEQGNVEKAIASYKTGISINPNLAEAHNNLGIAYSNQGKIEEAITSCKNAISINPNLALAHYSLACCYSLRNSKDQAIESLEKTIALDASYTDMAKVDEDFDSIKGSAEFQNLVGK